MTKSTKDRPATRATSDPFIKVAQERAHNHNQRREAYIQRLIQESSPANRDTIRAYDQAKKAQGLKPSSRMTVAQALSLLDQEGGGTTFAALTEEALTGIVERISRRYSPSSIIQMVAQFRAYYKWANDDELPKHVRRATKRRHQSYFREVLPIEPHELQALLEVAADTPLRARVAFWQAVLWTLWDSGFRISELLSLRVQDFLPDDRGGARLRLVERSGVDLKTGPRTIYVVECVGPIKVWLALHPHGTDAEAPLWPSQKDPRTTPWPCNMNTGLRVLCRKASIRNIHPHLFRHTCATRAAAAGWNEPQMRAYFGWSASSEMPAHYIHLSQRDMEERVRQDANVNSLGGRRGTDMDDQALDAVLKRSLKRLLTEG